MFRPGERVFLPGSSGEPAGMAETLLSTPGISIITSFVPGINRLPGNWAPCAEISGPFAYPGSGYRHLPVSYGALARLLRDNALIDTVVVQVSRPDSRGICSTGPAAEFIPIALEQDIRKIGVLNAQLNWAPCSPGVHISAFDEIVERDAPIPTYESESEDYESSEIAKFVASYIDDGMALQTGLGRIPRSLMTILSDRRRLRIHSGMLSDGVRDLVRAGALDADWPHATAVFLGSTDLYRWLGEQDVIRVMGCHRVHDPGYLASIEKLIAVNSALEVDLLGQCNLETAMGRQVSGGGGASDFARAARLSSGGLSIIALPAGFGSSGSRIKARLGADSLVTLARTDVDLIITDQGVADLRGLDAHRRAQAIIEIALPRMRAELAQNWHDMARKMGL